MIFVLKDSLPIYDAVFLGTATQTTEAVETFRQVHLCIQMVVTISGGGVGSLTLQKSVDGLTWFDDTAFTQNINANGNYMWEIKDYCPGYFRVKMNATAGTLSAVIKVNGKGA